MHPHDPHQRRQTILMLVVIAVALGIGFMLMNMLTRDAPAAPSSEAVAPGESGTEPTAVDPGAAGGGAGAEPGATDDGP